MLLLLQLLTSLSSPVTEPTYVKEVELKRESPVTNRDGGRAGVGIGFGGVEAVVRMLLAEAA